MKALILFALAGGLQLAGCYTPAVATSHTNNPAVPVDYLFAHDGCRVYRFQDNGSHYYVRCDGSDGSPSAATISNASCGHHCVREELIPSTSVAPPAGSGAPVRE